MCKDTEKGRSDQNDSANAPFYSAKLSTNNNFLSVLDINALSCCVMHSAALQVIDLIINCQFSIVN